MQVVNVAQHRVDVQVGAPGVDYDWSHGDEVISGVARHVLIARIRRILQTERTALVMWEWSERATEVTADATDAATDAVTDAATRGVDRRGDRRGGRLGGWGHLEGRGRPHDPRQEPLDEGDAPLEGRGRLDEGDDRRH